MSTFVTESWIFCYRTILNYQHFLVKQLQIYVFMLKFEPLTSSSLSRILSHCTTDVSKAMHYIVLLQVRMKVLTADFRKVRRPGDAKSDCGSGVFCAPQQVESICNRLQRIPGGYAACAAVRVWSGEHAGGSVRNPSRLRTTESAATRPLYVLQTPRLALQLSAGLSNARVCYWSLQLTFIV